MKQHITVEQLNELSEKGKEKLREWWKPIEGDLSFEPAYSWSYQGYKKGFLHDYDRGWEPEQVKGSMHEQLGIIKNKGWVASCHHPIGKKSKIVIKEKACKSIVESMINEDGDAYVPSKRALPLLSISQMIEFLDEKYQPDYSIKRWLLQGAGKRWSIKAQENHVDIGKLELCDCLWEAVKEVLNERP